MRGSSDGAAQESNLPSLGLPDLTGFEDRLGHRARAAPRRGYHCRRGILSRRVALPTRPRAPYAGGEPERGRALETAPAEEAGREVPVSSTSRLFPPCLGCGPGRIERQFG